MSGSGRRRRSGKTRKMRGGNFYGAAVDPQIGSAGLAYPAVENVAVNKSGDPIPDAVMPKSGGRRRGRTSKKSRKGGKHRRGHKSRKMRGGAGVVNSAGVGYGYGGRSITTSGPPDASAYASRVGGAPMGADMVRQLPQ